MKLLLEGSLNETLMLKDLLAGILQAEAPGVSVLQLFVDNNQYGEIFFLGGHFVVGARLCTTELGATEALNHLLQLKEASFYYHACDSLESLPADKPLKIDLKELISSWQFVPPLSSNDLLDKIFNRVETQDKEVAISESPYIDTESPTTPEPFSDIKSGSAFVDKQSDIEWELVNPLLLGASAENKISFSSEDLADNPHSTQELRSLSQGTEWQRKLRDLILILILLLITLIVILCFAWLLMNSPSTETSPKRYPSPFFHHGNKKTPTTNHSTQH